MITGDTDRLVMGGPFGSEPLADTFARLDRFAELGGRLVETAHSYEGGRAQRAIGEWFRQNPGVLGVVTKIGHDQVHRGDVPLTPETVRSHAHAAAEALHVECIDEVLYHSDDPKRAVEELAETLHGLVASGTAQRVGASNWAPDRFAALADLLRAAGDEPVASYQYGLAIAEPERLDPGNRAATDDVLAVLDERSVLLSAWSSQAGGYFSRTASSPRSVRYETPVNRARRERVRRFAADVGEGPGVVALAWTVRRPNTRAAIGPRTTAQLDSSFRALDIALSDADAAFLRDGAPA